MTRREAIVPGIPSRLPATTPIPPGRISESPGTSCPSSGFSLDEGGGHERTLF